MSSAVESDHALTRFDGMLMHLPRRASPMFPQARRAWDVVCDRINDGSYRGARIELDAHACVLTKPELVALVDDLCAQDERRTPESKADVDADWCALRDYVAALAEGSYLVVVASL